MITLNRAVNKQVKGFIRQPHCEGYPLILLMQDGCSLCHSCAKENFKIILEDSREGWKTGWTAAGVEIFWEGEEFCANCNRTIESAYGPVENN